MKRARRIVRKTPAKKNQADATLRNVRAANRKIAALTKRVKRLEHRIDAVLSGGSVR